MKISVCLLIRDENEYLEEWLNWHRNIGIEHFYIYDNMSRIPISETIQDCSDVTIIRWDHSYTAMQIEVYTDCLYRFGE